MAVIVIFVALFIGVFIFSSGFQSHKEQTEAQFKAAERERLKREEQQKAAEEAIKKADEEKRNYEVICAKLKNSALYINVKSEIYQIVSSHIDEIKDTFVTENNDDLLAVTIGFSEIKVFSYNSYKFKYGYEYCYDSDDEVYRNTNIIKTFTYDENALNEIYKVELNKIGYSNFDATSVQAFYDVLQSDLSLKIAQTPAELVCLNHSYSEPNFAYLLHQQVIQINFNKCYKTVKPVF